MELWRAFRDVETCFNVSECMGQSPLVLLHNFDEFSENGEFELEFDAVDKTFDCLLEDVQVFVLDGEEGDLEILAGGNKEMVLNIHLE